MADEKMADEELETVPSITLDDDDIAHRQQQAVSKKLRFSSGKPPPKTWLVIVSAVLVGGLAGGVFVLKQQLDKTRVALQSAEARIEQLEQKLTSTDTSVTESKVALAATIKSIDESTKKAHSEIRKLWGVAYDRNRKAIAANKAALEKQVKDFAPLQTDYAKTSSMARANSQLVNRLQVKVQNSEALAKESAQRVEFVQENAVELEEALNTLNAKVDNDISQQLKSHDDAIKSIDVHRRNVSSDIRKIKEELLKQKTP